ncbi:hypothetical protein DFA_01604 [Cavenderia fasciculata]|uniref:Uncharacterized protein n=1 Tax=Cavenderia fasciculata TaxID=261658 RepID=F4PTP8_CACFS|nr:uncharacterized protein DFA_01604 [Cavenderia fasciculata]EGG21718.1 hypothetical protein DFA_01604 [Cavenderia fasciculata]|eukprot:XP_004359568.1 hypothetical protein DFA_01604 [Cavenderia fasciculata]
MDEFVDQALKIIFDSDLSDEQKDHSRDCLEEQPYKARFIIDAFKRNSVHKYLLSMKKNDPTTNLQLIFVLQEENNKFKRKLDLFESELSQLKNSKGASQDLLPPVFYQPTENSPRSPYEENVSEGTISNEQRENIIEETIADEQQVNFFDEDEELETVIDHEEEENIIEETIANEKENIIQQQENIEETITNEQENIMNPFFELNGIHSFRSIFPYKCTVYECSSFR